MIVNQKVRSAMPGLNAAVESEARGGCDILDYGFGVGSVEDRIG